MSDTPETTPEVTPDPGGSKSMAIEPTNPDSRPFSTAHPDDTSAPLRTNTVGKSRINPESVSRLIGIGKALERGDTAYLAQVSEGIQTAAGLLHDARRTGRPGYRPGKGPKF